MPLYDYICDACHERNDDVLQSYGASTLPRRCDCGAFMRKDFSTLKIVPDIFPKDGIFLEHVSAEGKRFFSKQEMKNYAKTHDLELGALG